MPEELETKGRCVYNRDERGQRKKGSGGYQARKKSTLPHFCPIYSIILFAQSSHSSSLPDFTGETSLGGGGRGKGPNDEEERNPSAGVPGKTVRFRESALPTSSH